MSLVCVPRLRPTRSTLSRRLHRVRGSVGYRHSRPDQPHGAIAREPRVLAWRNPPWRSHLCVLRRLRGLPGLLRRRGSSASLEASCRKQARIRPGLARSLTALSCRGGLMMIAGWISLVFTLEHNGFRSLAALLALGTAWALAPVLRSKWLEIQGSTFVRFRASR